MTRLAVVLAILAGVFLALCYWRVVPLSRPLAWTVIAYFVFTIGGLTFEYIRHRVTGRPLRWD